LTEEEINQIIAAFNPVSIDPGMTLLNAIVQNPTSSGSAAASVSQANSVNSGSGGRPSAQGSTSVNQLAYWGRNGTAIQQRAIRVTGLKLYVYLMDTYNSVSSSLATVLLLQLGGVDGMFKYYSLHIHH
jgi:hypothetical protein